MISRVTAELAKEQNRIPKRVFCLFPRRIEDGRLVWLDHVWEITKWQLCYNNLEYYLTYDEALVNHWEYDKK